MFKWLRDKFLELNDNLGGWKNTLTILFGFLAGAKLVSMLTGIGRLVAGVIRGSVRQLAALLVGWVKLAQRIAQLAIKNPWLLMFIPANNTPTTSEEMASIGGIGSNIVPERQQAYEALRKENPGKDFSLMSKSSEKFRRWDWSRSSERSRLSDLRRRPRAKVLLDWMGPMFNKLESLYQLPAGLLKSVAITESGGNQFAMSGAGAKGLFQFMDGTARDMWACVGMMYSTRKSQLRQQLSTLASCCGRTAETLAKHWHHITGNRERSTLWNGANAAGNAQLHSESNEQYAHQRPSDSAGNEH